MNIIGQKELLNTIDALVKKDNFPRFSIIVGEYGSGKKMIAEYVSKKICCDMIPVDSTADSIRDAVDMAYTVQSKVLYVIYDFENVANTVKGILLKVTEEPPNNAYFIITVNDMSSVLDTILSRGHVFNMDRYKKCDFDEFIKYKKYDLSDKAYDIICNNCSNLFEIENIVKNDIDVTSELVNTFCNVIGQAGISNELKVVTKLSTKSDDTGINPTIFIKMCNNEFLNRLKKKYDKKYFQSIKCTTKALSDLNKKGSNVKMILDDWIIRLHLIMTGGELF